MKQVTTFALRPKSHPDAEVEQAAIAYTEWGWVGQEPSALMPFAVFLELWARESRRRCAWAVPWEAKDGTLPLLPIYARSFAECYQPMDIAQPDWALRLDRFANAVNEALSVKEDLGDWEITGKLFGDPRPDFGMIVTGVVRHRNRADCPYPPYYVTRKEWNEMNAELMKRESPLHEYTKVDAEGRIICRGVEILPYESIP